MDLKAEWKTWCRQLPQIFWKPNRTSFQLSIRIFFSSLRQTWIQYTCRYIHVLQYRTNTLTNCALPLVIKAVEKKKKHEIGNFFVHIKFSLLCHGTMIYLKVMSHNALCFSHVPQCIVLLTCPIMHCASHKRHVIVIENDISTFVET